MSEAAVHVFNHHAMATTFQVRIAGEERDYAAQAARAAFDMVDRIEGLLSRFRENSEISQLAGLNPGERLRLSEPTFACLEVARQMEAETLGAFSVIPAKPADGVSPRWSLSRADLSVVCEEGRLELDTGAIGKGFALDRAAEELADWECGAFLLIAGGSSILAGSPPEGLPGWSSGLGDDHSDHRYWLKHGSLSGSGIAVQGAHILDPRTGIPARQRFRAWAFAPSAAVSDALSTAGMVLSEAEIAQILSGRESWAMLLNEGGEWRHYGKLEVQRVLS